MKGSMMDYPLSLQAILERIPKTYPAVEIVSRLPDGSLHRYTYLDFYRRAKSLAEALHRAGLQPGDRVGTLCWNHYAHLEAYFGVPAAGGVVHTLNLRLHPQELAFIVNHAQDRFLIVDDVLLPLFEQFRDKVKPERVFVVRHEKQALPAGTDDYEELLASAGGGYEFPRPDENDAAAMCFTSGTTGNSKGVLYSHRALILHALAFSLPDAFCVSQHDVAMALAPMFHANAHGLPHVAIMLGCKLVLPGRQLDAASILDLFSSEQVTLATAVPTVWAGILEALEKDALEKEALGKKPGRWKLAQQFRGFVGGTAVPEALVRKLDQRGLRLIQVWGMTETTPVAVCSTLKSHMLPGRKTNNIACASARAVRCPSWRCAWCMITVKRRGTGLPWANCMCADHGLPPATSTHPARKTAGPPTAGCAPATLPPSTRKVTCRLPTAPRT